MGNSGSSNNYTASPYRPPTSSGFLGRGRNANQYMKIDVVEITHITLGRELIRRCGNEGQHQYLDAAGQARLQFLRAAISFIDDARNDGADMRNAAFILLQPQREFVIQAGDGDWEFSFVQDQYGEIYGRNVRKPFLRYMWDGIKSVVYRVGAFVGGALSIGAGAAQLALPF